MINLCHCIVESYEEYFISIAGDYSFTFSRQMSAIEIASILSNIDLNISQLCILLRILRYKLGAKIYEPEMKMKDISCEMIEPQFGEYKYFHKAGCTPGLIIYWVRDSVTML